MARAKFKFKLEDKDRGFRKIMAELEKAAEGEAYAKVGLMGPDVKDIHADEGDPINSVELGIIHEFGVEKLGIPERSFLRRTVDNKKGEWFALARELFGLVYDGRLTIKRTLGLLGAKASSDVKSTITEGEGIPPPNAPSTIERKLGGSRSHPRSTVQKSTDFLKGLVTGKGVRTLVDTGRMLGSITWQVVIHGGEEHGGGEGKE